MEKIQIDEVLKVEVFHYKNSKLPIEERVQDLIKQMTLEEKVAQMMGIWKDKTELLLDENEQLDFNKIEENLKYGIGQIGRLSDTAGGQTAYNMALMANELQKYFVEKTRLGIPVVFHEECLHGMAGPEATSYPQPIGMAASWNPDLVREVYSTIAKETRIRGVHQALTPVVDVAREPRWGRVEETFGEDPYLVGQLGIAAVQGLQGDGKLNNQDHLVATLKHYAAHGQPESGSNCGPVNISERVLRDTFFPPFKDAIQKAGVLSVMASYNEIDGVPSHANKWLLKNVLRDEWGFKGYVVSDYFAITELNVKEETTGHMVAGNKKDAAKIALEAGVNIELPDPDCYPNLVSLVQEGVVSESILDELITPMLRTKFELGLFENPYVDASLLNIDKKLEENRAIALKAAHETITLLKNEKELLPLKPEKLSSIAVIGPNANEKLLGGYSGIPKYYTTVLEGIKAKVGDKVNIHYSEGCKITLNTDWNEDEIQLPDPEDNRKAIAEAVKVALKSDLVILVIGGNEQTSREAWNTEHMGDRTDLELFGMQNQLVDEIVATGKDIVAVMFNGRPLSINNLNKKVHSILECWYLGQESGNAVADALFGDINPSGKLPISFPRSAGHIPCYYNKKPSARRGYIFEENSALFPFGYGLSYSSFTLGNLTLHDEIININESAKITIEIENTGDKEGSEVVQLYIRDCVSSVTRPVKELKGFQKVKLAAGEKKKISFTINNEHLAFFDINYHYVVEPGEFEIMVGTSSKDEDLLKVLLSVK